MRKAVSILLLCSTLFALSACGTGKVEESAGGGLKDTQEALSEESAQEISENIAKTESYTGSNILIAYFTWADNTNVEDKDAAVQSALSHYDSVGDSADYDGVDATTSASVLPPGNTAQMAEWIWQRVGGDLFSITVTEPYSSDYDECLDRAADEKAEDAGPPLKSRVENMDSYDIVFLGFPNWWYTVPMAVHSFVEEYDWSGKMVIPFVTHGTGGLASCIDDLEEALAPATIMEPIGVYMDDIKSAQPEIQEWIAGLNIDLKQKGGREMAEKNDKKIRIVLDGGEIVVKMENNPAAEDLLGRLPLTMKFEDFNGTEKIHYLESSLDTAGAPDECTPKAGDLAYYAPWGNLAFFYQDFRNSPQLVPLGSIESGAQYLEQFDEYAEVTMELVP